MSEDIRDLVEGVVDGSISDEDLTTWLKQVHSEGISDAETISLTEAMRDSGEILSWDSTFSELVVDKHSTGGVGAKVSLVLAPALAACGLKVPMISGRGLGHTGGTLDKLESIPGFSVELDSEQIRRQVLDIGLAMVGQTERLVPADRRMYALRDVTGTIDSIPLITSSIVSKKAAEGLSALVLDVKFGRAAFMTGESKARELAASMVAASQGMGVTATAVLSTMDAPLGCSIGNSLEVLESVETLCGNGPADLEELVCIQGGLLLHSTGLAEDRGIGALMIHDSLHDGSALNCFRLMVEAQGGDSSILANDSSLMTGLGLIDSDLNATSLCVAESGWVQDIDALSIALVCQDIGTGRLELGDPIDRAVGAILEVQLGDRIESGEPWITLYHRNEVGRSTVESLIGAIVLCDEEFDAGSRIHEVIG